VGIELAGAGSFNQRSILCLLTPRGQSRSTRIRRLVFRPSDRLSSPPRRLQGVSRIGFGPLHIARRSINRWDMLPGQP
jgi:hypothetical protein